MLTLLVHPDADFRDTLSDKLEEQGGIFVHAVTTEREALNKLKQQDQTRSPYHLLVTNFDLAENRKTSCLPGIGFSLVKSLPGHGHPHTRCIVLSPGGKTGNISLEPAGQKIDLLDSSADKLFESVIDIAREIVNQELQKRTLSVVFKQDPVSHDWRFELNDQRGNPIIHEGNLVIPQDVIQVLGHRSEEFNTSTELNTTDRWLTHLALIGQELQGIIFGVNPHFRDNFDAALNEVGGIEKARFEFNVTQDTHRVALEALYRPVGSAQNQVIGFPAPQQRPEEVQFWMLKAPICRTFSLASRPKLNRQYRSTLFENDGQQMNCLIIQADVSGEVTIPGKFFKLPQLSNVVEECDWLERELNENRRGWGIGRVARVAVSELESGESFMERFQKLAKGDEWHLVHYAGHSLYISPDEGSAGMGYFFLPGGRTGIETLSAGRFSELLLKARFLFLSSCHSSEENFVLEMVRHGVPAVLGFRWDIDDELAAHYAKLFYKSLFKTKSIESAFVIARKEARDAHGAFERIWAAPMLMLLEPPVRAEAA